MSMLLKSILKCLFTKMWTKYIQLVFKQKFSYLCVYLSVNNTYHIYHFKYFLNKIKSDYVRYILLLYIGMYVYVYIY